MSDKIRKYVLPNLPYLFVFWFFSKIGTAYRIAPGTDFGTKLMGMLDTFPKAFETYWPGLGGIDLLVGLAGAAGVYLLIQSKIRQAKKFRRDAEYGTARFGTKEDIKPFVDPKFQNNVILTGTEFLTMNTRPKIPANARNLNACVIGSSGSGKTRFWLTPQLLQAHSSYVVVDPKGGTLDQCGRFLQREKYRVRVFNSIDFSKSMHYNPLAYIKTESDVLKFVTALIANTKGDGKEGDEFWTKAETLLYCALVAYIVFEGPEEERNMNTLVEMINSMEVREDDETFKNAVDYMFDGLERRSPQHFAVRQYKKYKLASGFACSYYNDKFDLKKGDGVYVDGKLEGLLGFITEVSYCFKIRLSEYKRVIYRVDTEIRGKLYLLGDFFAAFDEDVIPKEKILPWFVRPDNEDDVARSYGEGTEAELSDSEFTCDNLPLSNVIPYFCIDKSAVSAVVNMSNGRCYGTNEVEFTFDNVKARNMTCSCYEVGLCIHESTAVSALNGILAEIEKNKEFAEMYNKRGYIALIDKNSVIENTVNSNKTGCIELL